MQKIRLGIVLGLVMLATSSVRANVEVPSLFTDDMVLQRDAKLRFWGWADKGEMVNVVVRRGKKIIAEAETLADAKGKWVATLGPLKVGTPLTISIEGKNTIAIKNVLVGEVWLCSGQSNMAWTVGRSDNFEKEKQDAAKFPEIRQFKVAYDPTTEAKAKASGKWAVCSPDTVGAFSGTAYFFARKLHAELKVPIGLINSSVGGTAVEAWTSMPAHRNSKAVQRVLAFWDKAATNYDDQKAQALYQKRLSRWKVAAAKARKEKKRPPRRPRRPVHPRKDRNHPSNLYNGMISPIVGYTIRGAIWYQGERNTNLPYKDIYGDQLALLISDWRGRWGQGDFPFLWVQLPNLRPRVKGPIQATSGWAQVRQGMLEALRVPNTGMAVTIDIGNPKDIHPTNKQDFGRRLARVALATVYKKSIVPTGPLYESVKFQNGKAILSFTHTGKGLKAKGGQLKEFAIAGKGGTFVTANAKIEGDKVIVWSKKASQPVAVRYAWKDNPEATLYNAEGLPASPFRTDWPKRGQQE